MAEGMTPEMLAILTGKKVVKEEKPPTSPPRGKLKAFTFVFDEVLCMCALLKFTTLDPIFLFQELRDCLKD